MNEAERSGLSAMRDRWIGGGSAAGVAPAEWQALVASSDADERERRLLAIAGQAFDVGFRPAAPKTLSTSPPLPKLDLPTVPDRYRPLFRSALKNASDARAKLRVIGLTEKHGHVSHPLDWMPAASDLDAPRAYAPWIDWRQSTPGREAVLEPLSAENWDDFYPAARRIALADIRRSDPASARALLESKAGAESAEARLALIELLRVNLSAADAPYLQNLSSDRSGKVKQLAARLLARIGHGQSGSDADNDVKELADFIEQERTGIIRRRTIYTAKTLKNWTQTNRRNELFDNVPLIDLAKTLVASELDLVDGWQLGGKDDVDAAFTRMICESGSDAAVKRMGERLSEAGDAMSLAALLPRLDETAARAIMKIALSQNAAYIHRLQTIPDIAAGSFDARELMGSTLYKELRAIVADRRDGDRTTPDFSLLGYLATPAAAKQIINDLTAAGLGPADPSLALLRLNVALGER